MEEKFCQSCGMPMSEGTVYGAEKDGSVSKEFCNYCYENGEFLFHGTMEEMVDICVQPTAESTGMNEADTRRNLLEWFLTLNRWKG